MNQVISFQLLMTSDSFNHI